jgi:hypothetical protein
LEIRFGNYVREISLGQIELNYGDLVPKPKLDDQGNEIDYEPGMVKLRSIDAYRLVQPYVSARFIDQLRAVVPLAVYLALFQYLVLQQPVQDALIITGGLFAVIMGLMLFMEGLQVGLMPFGEALGTTLPSKASLGVVLGVAFLLGIGVTFAEPAIGSLKAAGAIVDINRAPYLYLLLNNYAETLVLMVGMGVGLAAVVGTLRFLNGWSLKPLIYGSLLPVMAMSLVISGNENLAPALGLAWDTGAVTTGPVTVPLVLSLGVGIAASAGKGSSTLSGFGIVTLASLFPIIAVLSLILYVGYSVSPEEILAGAGATAATVSGAWYETTPGLEIVLGFRAIVPLVLFLLAVLVFLLKEKIRQPGIVSYGISLCVLGMIVFNLGLTYGLAKLGAQSGSLVPGTFRDISTISGSPLFSFVGGISISIVFAWLLGFGATLAEPALNALGLTVENLTNGAFRKSMLMYAVSLGVGCGIALGVTKMLFDLPIINFLLVGYSIAIVLTYFSSEEFVNIAWDSAGVTTGPVTVPLVLALGLGFGDAMQVIEGFGILSMASVCPIIAVLSTGLWVNWAVKKRHKAVDNEQAEAEI